MAGAEVSGELPDLVCIARRAIDSKLRWWEKQVKNSKVSDLAARLLNAPVRINNGAI